MKVKDLNNILIKSAQLIETLEKENAELKEKLAKTEIISRSGDDFSKLASEVGESPDALFDALKSMSPSHRRMFMKLADTSFTLGEPSDYNDLEKSAEERLVDFMSN